MRLKHETPGIGVLDERYVNVAGDTMTGELIIQLSSQGSALNLINTTANANGWELRVLNDGSFKITDANALSDRIIIDSSGNITGRNFISSVATGTQPYACTSTTLNTNLNADLWDGYQFADYLNQAVLTTSSPTFDDLTLTDDLDVGGNAAFGSSGTISATKLINVDNAYTATSAFQYNIFSSLDANPAATSSATYVATSGYAQVGTAQTLSNGVIGIFGKASISNAIAAAMTGATGNSGLIGGYFTCDAEDGTVAYAAGVFFDLPSVDTGTITEAYGLRIGASAVGTGSIGTLYGLYFPNITQATTNWDIYHDGNAPNIGLKAAKTLTWKNAGGNILMSIKDTGSAGAFTFTGSFNSPVVSKTATYTATNADYSILCDATSGNITINLPTAVGISGRQYFIEKTDSSANTVTIDASGTETINGSLTQVISGQYGAFLIISNGTNWFIISSYS